MPISASRASPGPLTAQPSTDTLIGTLILDDILLHLIGDGEQINIQTTAGRTRNECSSVSDESERLQQLTCNLYFLNRIALSEIRTVLPIPREQSADAGRALDRSGEKRSGFGDAQMKRIAIFSAALL